MLMHAAVVCGCCCTLQLLHVVAVLATGNAFAFDCCLLKTASVHMCFALELVI